MGFLAAAVVLPAAGAWFLHRKAAGMTAVVEELVTGGALSGVSPFDFIHPPAITAATRSQAPGQWDAPGLAG